MRKNLLFLSLLLIAGCVMTNRAESFKPEFYAFYNGVDFGSPENEAQTLKELGYEGISQVREDLLAERVAAYDKVGLKVLSIYLPIKEEPIDPKIFRPLANRGAMIELTVKKILPGTVEAIRQTAETAARMKIRVVIYPHYGQATATMPKALELIEKVNHPNLGVMFNLCHFLRGEKAEKLDSILEQASPHLFSVSTSGADLDGKDWGSLIQTLDQGSFHQARLLRKLKELDYQGPVCLQCYKIAGDKRTNLKTSMAAWKQILTDL